VAASPQASARGLDWFTFFLADIQTGFGPFVAIYLTAHQWAQFDIGLVLTAGGLVALACQIPGGALVDAARSGGHPPPVEASVRSGVLSAASG
jgi:hypothetical protein